MYDKDDLVSALVISGMLVALGVVAAFMGVENDHGWLVAGGWVLAGISGVVLQVAVIAYGVRMGMHVYHSDVAESDTTSAPDQPA